MTSDPNRNRDPSDLRLIAHEVRYEQAAFWLNRIGALLTVGFSVVFLVLLGTSAGGARVDFLGNSRLIDYYVPAFVAYGVMAASFLTNTLSLVTRRESGLLKRLRLSPLPSRVLFGSILVSVLIVALVQVLLLLAIGRLGYDVSLPQSVGAFVITLVVGVISFTALSVAMSTVLPNQDTAAPVTSFIFFVLLFLSGLWFPLRPHSTLAAISSVFPVRHFIVAVTDSFSRSHSSWAWKDLLIVAAWGAVASVVALRRFRWTPWSH